MTINPRHDLYVGCEVVCVRSTYDPAQKTTITPELVEGQVYKIRWLGIYNHYLDGEYLGVRVEGIDRGICPHWGHEDQPFNANRFRPVVKDPLAWAKRIATDPEFKPSGDEGPLHPDGPLPEPKRVKETEDV
jgi:hypothetical protein